MLKRFLKKALRKSGKNYIPDETLPERLILNVLINRAFMMVRGLLFFRKKIFIGKKVSFKNKGGFTFGNNCTIEKHVSQVSKFPWGYYQKLNIKKAELRGVQCNVEYAEAFLEEALPKDSPFYTVKSTDFLI